MIYQKLVFRKAAKTNKQTNKKEKRFIYLFIYSFMMLHDCGVVNTFGVVATTVNDSKETIIDS